MRMSGVAEKYAKVVQDMYEDNLITVRCVTGMTNWFKLVVELHQGSVMSPFLFAMVIDRLTNEIKQESSWTMVFTDDIHCDQQCNRK